MLPSSLHRLYLLHATEAAVVVHRDGGSSQHKTCVPKRDNAGKAPKGERQSCKIRRAIIPKITTVFFPFSD